MPFVELPGVHLWYSDSGGAGLPVIFMHAATGTCDSWVQQEPDFTEANYRFIAYDRREWGRSRPAPTGDQPGYVSDDLHGLVNHLGLDRFHLVATAAGGRGALDYALLHPERVRSLVVSSSFGGVQDESYSIIQRRVRPPEIHALPVELRELGPSYRATDPEGVQRWLAIERVSHPVGSLDLTGQTPQDPITFARLETMKVPVLVICGDADLLSPPALMRLFADRIPDCRFETMPEAGHAAFWEQPDIWNKLVLEFIGQH